MCEFHLQFAALLKNKENIICAFSATISSLRHTKMGWAVYYNKVKSTSGREAAVFTFKPLKHSALLICGNQLRVAAEGLELISGGSVRLNFLPLLLRFLLQKTCFPAL